MSPLHFAYQTRLERHVPTQQLQRVRDLDRAPLPPLLQQLRRLDHLALDRPIHREQELRKRAAVVHEAEAELPQQVLLLGREVVARTRHDALQPVALRPVGLQSRVDEAPYQVVLEYPILVLGGVVLRVLVLVHQGRLVIEGLNERVEEALGLELHFPGRRGCLHGRRADARRQPAAAHL